MARDLKSRLPFQGSFTALVTPFDPSIEIDWGAFETLVRRQLEAGTDGLILAGTTGESPTLEDSELIEMIRRAHDLRGKKSKCLLVAGVGGNNTRACLGRIRSLNELPLDGYLAVTPYYNKPPQEGLIAHYTELARASRHPVILYNVPGRTGVSLNVETLVTLGKVKNIAALKEATTDLVRFDQIRGATSLPVLSGEDALNYYFLAGGGTGTISVTANVAPRSMKKFNDFALRGDFRKALEFHRRLLPLHRNLFLRSNPIPVKTLLALAGLLKNNFRPPLVAVPALSKELSPMLKLLEELGEI